MLKARWLALWDWQGRCFLVWDPNVSDAHIYRSLREVTKDKRRKAMNVSNQPLCSAMVCFTVAAAFLPGRSANAAEEKLAKMESHFARLGTNKVHYLTQG